MYQKEDAVQQEVNEAVKSLTLKVAEARLKGDVDGNGKIGTSDSVLLLQYAAEMTVLDEISAESADVNGDKAADTRMQYGFCSMHLKKRNSKKEIVLNGKICYDGSKLKR